MRVHSLVIAAVVLTLAGEAFAVDVARVVEVIDGDTLKVEIDDKIEPVRLIGIDTPETEELE